MTPPIRQSSEIEDRASDGPHDIALVIGDLEAGGAQRVLSLLARAWAESGRRICVITLSTPDGDFYSLDHRITRLTIAGKQDSASVPAAIANNLRRLWRLRTAIRRSGASRVVSFVGVTNILTVLAATGLGARVLISERNDPSKQSLGQVWDFLRARIYPRADLITANSRSAIATLAGYVPRQKLALVPNPLELPDTACRSAGRDSVVLSVGRLNRQKAHDVLLQAFAGLPPDYASWNLLIAGEGGERASLERLVTAQGIDERVSLPGTIKNLAPYYEASSIFVLASRFEGQPNALLEAMAHGMAVIVSEACKGALDVVEDDVSGLVVPADNAAALRKALVRLMRNAELRSQLGDEARRRIASFETRRVLAQWDELLALDKPSAVP